MAERISRRRFFQMGSLAAVGIAAAACAPSSKPVEVSATTAPPTPKEEPKTATPAEEPKKEPTASATQTPTRVAPTVIATEDPGARATRIAEAKKNMWPQLEWADAEQENNFLHVQNPNRVVAQEQLIGLRGCADKWVREGIIGVDRGIVTGAEVVAFEKKEGVILGLRVVEEKGRYGKGTLLLPLDLEKSVAQNNLFSLGGERVLAEDCQVAPTFVTANVDGLIPGFQASEIVWDKERNTFVAKDKEGRSVAFVNAQHEAPDGKVYPGWELIVPPTSTPKPPTATPEPATATPKPEVKTVEPFKEVIACDILAWNGWSAAPGERISADGRSIDLAGAKSGWYVFRSNMGLLSVKEGAGVELAFSYQLGPDAKVAGDTILREGMISVYNIAGPESDILNLIIQRGRVSLTNKNAQGGKYLPQQDINFSEGSVRLRVENAGAKDGETISIVEGVSGTILWKGKLPFTFFRPNTKMGLSLGVGNGVNYLKINDFCLRASQKDGVRRLK